MKTWLDSKNIIWCLTDILAAVTRIRSVQAHMRDFQRDVMTGKAKIPSQHVNMGAVLNLINVDPNSVDDECDVDDAEFSPPPLKRLKLGIDIVAAAARLDEIVPIDRPVATPCRRALVAISSEECDPDGSSSSPLLNVISPEEVAEMLFGKSILDDETVDAATVLPHGAPESVDLLVPLPLNADEVRDAAPNDVDENAEVPVAVEVDKVPVAVEVTAEVPVAVEVTAEAPVAVEVAEVPVAAEVTAEVPVAAPSAVPPTGFEDLLKEVPDDTVVLPKEVNDKLKEVARKKEEDALKKKTEAKEKKEALAAERAKKKEAKEALEKAKKELRDAKRELGNAKKPKVAAPAGGAPPLEILHQAVAVLLSRNQSRIRSD
jgi:hypothetical protein